MGSRSDYTFMFYHVVRQLNKGILLDYKGNVIYRENMTQEQLKVGNSLLKGPPLFNEIP